MNRMTPLELPTEEVDALAEFFVEVRGSSRDLAGPLSDADATVQSMPDASPAKWHLAHTTWFFEAMVLAAFSPSYRPFDDRFGFLFNSYYESVGARQPRPRRGMITRPTLDEILEYRRHVDDAILRLLAEGASEMIKALVELGCHHEQQHQELLLTDILHLFSQSPLKPAYLEMPSAPMDMAVEGPAGFVSVDGGVYDVGHGGFGFAFDSEGPRHRVHLESFRIADRLVTNAEWADFILDDGYRNPLLWLSDGWSTVRSEGWSAPLYWEERDGEFWTMTLRGFQRVDMSAPVTHVSYYEADAFANWSGRRLPTEAEWEVVARDLPLDGNFLGTGRFRPRAVSAVRPTTVRQMYGDVWEWTRSPFSPYPRFKAAEGAVGEYNGKFMSGQYVLRGGSCVTPRSHMRATYRNFFPPTARWQFSGLRLAEDT
jgi:ergothioneine biosynthesis protein EgtB